MSRQTDRQAARQNAKHRASAERLASRRAAGKALRERQLERELNGTYEGQRLVADCVALSRSRLDTRKLKKGQAFSRAEVQYRRFTH